MTGKQFGALIGAISLMFAYSLTTTALGFFIAPVTTELGYERAAFTFYMTIMIAVAMFTAPFIGKMLRYLGLRRLVLFSGLLGTGCFACFSFCHSLWAFYAVSVVMGLLYAAGTNIAAVIIVERWFPHNNGVFMGIVMAGSGLGGTVMSAILPTFLTEHGWRAGYLLLAVVWLILTVLAAVLAGSRPNARVNPAKKLSGITATDGQTFAQVRQAPSFYLLLLGLAILLIFSTFLQHMPAYYAEIGLSESEAGAMMSMYNLFFMLFKILEGILFDRFGNKILWLSIGAYAAGFLLLLGSHPALLVAGTIVLSAGMSSVAVLPPLVVTMLYGRRDFPAIWGIMSVAINIGKAVGLPLWGAIFDGTGSYRGGILLAPILLFGTGIILFTAFRLNRESEVLMTVSARSRKEE